MRASRDRNHQQAGMVRVKLGKAVATKGRFPYSSKDAAPARHNAKASIERSEEPAAGAPKETRSELAGGEISSSPVSKYASLY